MKILHVEAGMHLYGGALQVCFLAEGLNQRGVQNLLVCPPGSAVADEARRRGISVESMPIRGDLDVVMVPRLVRLLKKWRPDVLHLHSRRGCDVWGSIAGRIAGVPVVLSRRVDNTEPDWWAKIKYRIPQRVVTISKGIERVLLSEGVSPGRVICVPSAVDTDQYIPNAEASAELRREFGLPEAGFVIGMAAQFIERKGYRVLLAAMPSILRAFPAAQLLLFGRGPMLASLQQQVESDTLLRTHVRFAGFRDDLWRWLPGLDLLVHPAYMEGLGVTLLQGASSGVPIVAGRAGGIPEIVLPGVNGELIEPGDVSGLADKVNGLLDRPDVRKKYGQAGRDHVLLNFSISAMVNGNLNVYRALIGSEFN